MATSVISVFGAGRLIIRNAWSRFPFSDQSILKYKNIRCLFSDQALGLDKYQEQREKIGAQFTGLKDKFFVRMKEYASQERQSMVFTEDLKNVMFLAEDNPEDTEICIRIMKKFHKQNKELRFGTFVFGPVVMRWVHRMNQPDLAWSLITSEDLVGFFDQVVTHQIAMDLFIKHKQYSKVLDLFDRLQERNLHGTRYHREPVLLALGACYHMNTPESYQRSVTIIQDARGSGGTLLRRGLTFAAALALRQGHPDIAMEMLSLTPYSNYITVRNLRLQVLAEMSRLEDIFPILRLLVDRDLPQMTPAREEICQETLDHIQNKLDKTKDKEMSHIFEQICRALRENNHITMKTIDDLLAAPIQGMQTYRGDKVSSYQQGSTSRPNRSSSSYRGDNWGQPNRSL